MVDIAKSAFVFSENHQGIVLEKSGLLVREVRVSLHPVHVVIERPARACRGHHHFLGVDAVPVGLISKLAKFIMI